MTSTLENHYVQDALPHIGNDKVLDITERVNRIDLCDWEIITFIPNIADRGEYQAASAYRDFTVHTNC